MHLGRSCFHKNISKLSKGEVILLQTVRNPKKTRSNKHLCCFLCCLCLTCYSINWKFSALWLLQELNIYLEHQEKRMQLGTKAALIHHQHLPPASAMVKWQDIRMATSPFLVYCDVSSSGSLVRKNSLEARLCGSRIQGNCWKWCCRGSAHKWKENVHLLLTCTRHIMEKVWVVKQWT